MTREQAEKEFNILLSRNFGSDIEAIIALSKFKMMAAAYGYRGQFRKYSVENSKIVESDKPWKPKERAIPKSEVKPKEPEKVAKPEKPPEVGTKAEESAPKKRGKESQSAQTRRGPKPRSLKREEKKSKEQKPKKSSSRHYKH